MRPVNRVHHTTYIIHHNEYEIKQKTMIAPKSQIDNMLGEWINKRWILKSILMTLYSPITYYHHDTA